MSSTAGLVSVIIAVFNGRREIEATLRAAFEQDYSPLEVIVIDGGSTDGTQEVVLRHRGRLAAFVSAKDRGIGDAWNKGLAQCAGEFVALLNCGDRWPKDFVAMHMTTLRATPRAIQYGTTFMTESQQVVAKSDRSFDPTRLSDGFGFLHTSVMTSKAVYDELGPFDLDKRIAIDAEWMLRALRLGIPFTRVGVHNFMATGGISSTQWLRGQFEYIDALKAHGFVAGSCFALRLRKRAQALYLALGLPRIRRLARMQTALLAIAALNAISRTVPFHSPRRLAWSLAGFKVSRTAVMHQGVRWMARRRLSVGEGTIINRGTLIDNRFPVEIGRHISIAHDCRIYTTGHDVHSPDFAIQTRPVRIEDYAVLFAGAVVMPGVTIGTGAVVLPFAVVTKSVEPMTVVGGVPAVIRGHRTGEPSYRLDYGYWFAI
jgi:acetyltransferase-like isoleucine patch superfamily enzyme/GT2 family glycosyltransferase